MTDGGEQVKRTASLANCGQNGKLTAGCPAQTNTESANGAACYGLRRFGCLFSQKIGFIPKLLTIRAFWYYNIIDGRNDTVVENSITQAWAHHYYNFLLPRIPYVHTIRTKTQRIKNGTQSHPAAPCKRPQYSHGHISAIRKIAERTTDLASCYNRTLLRYHRRRSART